MSRDKNEVDISYDVVYTKPNAYICEESKMEISAKEARSRLSYLLKKAEEGNEIVIARRGKRVARLIAAEDRAKCLPTLRSFRASLKVKGASLSSVLSRERQEVRY